MKSRLSLNPKFLGMPLFASILSFVLFLAVSVEPVNAQSCRDLAVAIGGCAGPTDETCILDYCAGKAFEDIMDDILDEAREDMKKENKEETEEEVAEETIGTCDVGGGASCILFSYITNFCFIIIIPDVGVPSVTLGGVPIPFSIGSDEEFEITVAVPSTQVLEFKCTGGGIGGCIFVLVPVAGGSCSPDPSVSIPGDSTKTFTCSFPAP